MNLCILIKLLNQPSLINYCHRVYIVSSCRQHESKYIYINRTRDDVITWKFSALTRWISPTKGPVMGTFDISFLIGLIGLLNKELSCRWFGTWHHCSTFLCMVDTPGDHQETSHMMTVRQIRILASVFFLVVVLCNCDPTWHKDQSGHCGDVSFHPLDTRLFFHLSDRVFR